MVTWPEGIFENDGAESMCKKVSDVRKDLNVRALDIILYRTE